MGVMFAIFLIFYVLFWIFYGVVWLAWWTLVFSFAALAAFSLAVVGGVVLVWEFLTGTGKLRDKPYRVYR